MMNPDLQHFLAAHISLSEKEIELIHQLRLIRELKKGDLLLREGETSKYCYFVLKGCIRSYYILDGEEKTTDFFTEGQPITPVSYRTKQPSEYYLSCIEDCIVSIGSETTTELIRKEIPQMEQLIHRFNDKLLAESQIRFENYVTLSPQDRYIKLMEQRPDLLQRVPLYMLAGYLGIKPESLSRIRKRLVKK